MVDNFLSDEELSLRYVIHYTNKHYRITDIDYSRRVVNNPSTMISGMYSHNRQKCLDYHQEMGIKEVTTSIKKGYWDINQY